MWLVPADCDPPTVGTGLAMGGGCEESKLVSNQSKDAIKHEACFNFLFKMVSDFQKGRKLPS
jgi:hypothetical protein